MYCGQADQYSRSLLEEMEQKEHPDCCQQPVPAARLWDGMGSYQCSCNAGGKMGQITPETLHLKCHNVF